jgi:transglutaminase-like putative cysteine protease
MVSIKSLTVILSYAITLCGVIPLFPWLEGPARLILLAGLLAGLWQERRGIWPIKNWMFNAAIVPLFLYYTIQFSRANPVQPVVSILSVMLAARLGGPKNSRHYLQISALSLFCLASSSLYSLSSLFLVYLALMLFLVAVQLVLLTFYDQDQLMQLSRADLRKVLAGGLLMPLASLPLLIFFFPLLPRTQLPLWNFLAAPASRTSGFSDSVEPGSSSATGSSRVLAFRVEMPRQPQHLLYWRGTVFNRIEDRRWVRTTPPFEQIVYPLQRIRQTVYPEPGAVRALMALDAPVSLSLPRAVRRVDGVYEYQGNSGKRFTYVAESVPGGALATVGDIKRSFYLTLPHNLPERIRDLADTVRRQGNSDSRRLEQLEIYFRNAGYRYSMTGLPTGENALEQFLFEGKQGNCEFFASSFALILRAAGIPSRLVGGYLGGEYNQLGGYYLVSEDQAHVWVEAYITGQGWLRIDPSSFARNASAVWAPTGKSLLLKVRMTLDSLDHAWNRSVITYDFERQIDVARTVGTRLQGIEAGRIVKNSVPYLGSAFVILLVSLVVWKRKGLFLSREERLLRRFYRRLDQDCGIVVERGRAGLFEVAERTGNSDVRSFVDIYAGAVYRDRRLNEQEFGLLQNILKGGFR